MGEAATIQLETGGIMVRKTGTDKSVAFSLEMRRHTEIGCACEYIDTNLTTPIRLSDVCRYANVNIRTLQRLFKRELGLSPTQYILLRRLHEVRRALIDSDAEPGRVTTTAINHGFNHLGHFAVRYKRFFGETPRQTLHKRTVPTEAVRHLSAA